MKNIFHQFAKSTAALVGSPWTFLAAALVLAVWLITGPIFHYSDTWQLVINTGTSLVTFLVVFLIQNTQNRDSKAMHLKLDELLCAVKEARSALIDLENMPDEEVERLEKEFIRLAKTEVQTAQGNG